MAFEFGGLGLAFLTSQRLKIKKGPFGINGPFGNFSANRPTNSMGTRIFKNQKMSWQAENSKA